MAWSIWSQNLNKLIMRINGVDQIVTPITWPQLYNPSSDATTICANPYNVYIGHFGADGSAEKAFIAAITPGTINLATIDNLVSNGQTVAFYNEAVGYSTRLEFVKSISGGNSRYTMRFVAYGQTSTASDQYVTVRHGNFQNVKSSIGIAYNDASGYFAPYYVESYTVPDGYGDYRIYNMLSSANLLCTLVFDALTKGNTPPEPSQNPYSGGGTSEPSGDPSGDYDDTSDVISVPSVPSFNLGITSLINVWVPSTTDINNLAAYLWSNFDLTDPTKTLSKMFTDPLSYILSLHMLPFTVDSSTAITVTLAGLATTVSMPPATVQFKDIDCGSVTINEYWGNYLDYTYTKIVLCLPFCGQVDLDPDEVMGKTIKVKYRVDIITGAFVCFVYIDGDKVLGQYAGNCAAQIPISAADFSRLNAAVLGVAGAAASAFGSAALGGHGGMLNGASGGLISSIAANAQNAKIRAQHSGGLTGAPGFMGIQKPYLIIHRPRQSVPEDYEKFKGYPSNVTMQLSSCTGFTSVREIKLNGLPFTDGELTELKSILEGGVIL